MGRGLLRKDIRKHVPAVAEVHTDALHGYQSLSPEYVHKFVDHAVCYAKDGVHTNSLENFWSLLKRWLKGTYVHVAPFHLSRSLDEQTYRFNVQREEK